MGIDEDIRTKNKKTAKILKKRSEIEKDTKNMKKEYYKMIDKNRLYIHENLSDDEIQEDIMNEIPKLPYARPNIWREMGILIRQNELIRRQNEIIIRELKKLNE